MNWGKSTAGRAYSGACLGSGALYHSWITAHRAGGRSAGSADEDAGSCLRELYELGAVELPDCGADGAIPAIPANPATRR